MLWLGAVALLLGIAVAPSVLGQIAVPYSPAGVSVLAFVLTLLAMTAAVGSLAVREALVRVVSERTVDAQTPAGWVRVLRDQLGAWALCLIVAGLGSVLAFAAARPELGWPYVLAAGALLLFHTPRAAVLGTARRDAART
jgi:hypothetical protein